MDYLYEEVCDVVTLHYLIQVHPLRYTRSPAFEKSLAEKEMPHQLQKWYALIDEITQNVNNRVSKECSEIDTPSFKGKILLNQEQTARMLYKQELVIHLSLIGKFYTVYGLDEISILDLDGNDEVIFEPVVYTSPYSVYEDWFNLVRNKVELSYSNYKFIPYHLLITRIEGLSTGTVQEDGLDATVFQALFSSEDISSYRTIGDHFYE